MTKWEKVFSMYKTGKALIISKEFLYIDKSVTAIGKQVKNMNKQFTENKSIKTNKYLKAW